MRSTHPHGDDIFSTSQDMHLAHKQGICLFVYLRLQLDNAIDSLILYTHVIV